VKAALVIAAAALALASPSLLPPTWAAAASLRREGPTPDLRAGADSGAYSNHYDLDVVLDPATGALAVTGTFAIVADTARTAVRLLLNGALTVQAIDGPNVAGVTVTRGTHVGSLPLPTTQRVDVRLARPLARGDTTTLRLAYAGRLDTTAAFEWGRGLVSPRWTELSVGALWYPVLLDEPEVTARLRLTVPAEYRVVAPGRVRQLAAGRWELAAPRAERQRVTFAASRAWHVTSRALTPGRRVTVYAARPDARVERVLAAAGAAYTAMARWYGPPAGADTELAILLPNDSLGLHYPTEAYATGGTLIALSTQPDETVWLDTFHHELCHLWWTGGRPGTADEFLSESPAEYHALRLGGAAFGEAWLERQRAKLARGSAGIPGSLRTVQGAYPAELSTLLYERGPTVLWALHDRLGEAAMTALLRATRERRIDTLAGFFAVLAAREGDAVRRWFEAQI
jgi:hypothetical protein